MSLNVLVVIILLGGWFSGKLFNKIKLPSILCMVVFGIISGYFLKTSAPDVLWKIEPFLKSFALIVILLRAGLGISKKTLEKAGVTAILMTVVPCIFEGIGLTFTFHLLFNFDWAVSGLTAFMLSAVSPAVIVPSMLDLKSKGYGEENEVPTIILAGAAADDVIAITFFSVFLSLATAAQVNILQSILSIPVSIIIGVIPGAIIGILLTNYFKKKHEHIEGTEKTLILLTISMMLVQIGDWTHSAALLGVMTIGFILLEKAEPIAHELSHKVSKIWVFAEIILFVLIGFSVDINVAMDAGLKGILAISIGLLFRSLGVIVATSFSKMSINEKIFCVIAYIPKATVQAALGSVALANGIKEGKIILAIAVLSIIFTAPIGMIGIKLTGKKLLDIDFPAGETED